MSRKSLHFDSFSSDENSDIEEELLEGKDWFEQAIDAAGNNEEAPVVKPAYCKQKVAESFNKKSHLRILNVLFVYFSSLVSGLLELQRLWERNFCFYLYQGRQRRNH